MGYRTLREHLTRGWTLNHQRFEENARELEAAFSLVRKAARSPELDTDSGRGLVEKNRPDPVSRKDKFISIFVRKLA